MSLEQIVRGIAALIDRHPREDPSPLDLARAMQHGLDVVLPFGERGRTERAFEVVVMNFGDWAGGRVEPSDVADVFLQAFDA